MKPHYPLRLFFDCSTAHISPQTRTWLETRASRGEELIGATPYGWFLWVEETARTDLPADLCAVMDYARQLGAEYILFDRDAPEDDAVPVFDD